MTATHNISWIFEAVNAKGQTERFQCGKAIDLSAWEDAREAAIFFTINETIPALEAEANRCGGAVWHLTKPGTIEVFRVHPLSDVGLA